MGPINEAWMQRKMGYPPGSVKLEDVDRKPIYGNWWRRLLRMPRYYRVTYLFTVGPKLRTVTLERNEEKA